MSNGYIVRKFTDHLTVSKLSKLQRFALRLALNKGSSLWSLVNDFYGYDPEDWKGPKPTAAQYAAVSRALSRLQGRGLITKKREVVQYERYSICLFSLTPAGIELATRLQTTFPPPSGPGSVLLPEKDGRREL